MDDRILKKIDQHLLDQSGIHRKHEKICGHGNTDADVRKTFLQTPDRFRDNLLHYFGRFFDFVVRSIVDPCDSQKIFHHI